MNNEDDKTHDDHGQSNVWINVYSNVMPRAFKFVKFSPCETMFATSEVNVLIKFKPFFYLINNLGISIDKNLAYSR